MSPLKLLSTCFKTTVYFQSNICISLLRILNNLFSLHLPLCSLIPSRCTHHSLPPSDFMSFCYFQILDNTLFPICVDHIFMELGSSTGVQLTYRGTPLRKKNSLSFPPDVSTCQQFLQVGACETPPTMLEG